MLSDKILTLNLIQNYPENKFNPQHSNMETQIIYNYIII